MWAAYTPGIPAVPATATVAAASRHPCWLHAVSAPTLWTLWRHRLSSGTRLLALTFTHITPSASDTSRAGSLRHPGWDDTSPAPASRHRLARSTNAIVCLVAWRLSPRPGMAVLQAACLPPLLTVLLAVLLLRWRHWRWRLVLPLLV